MTCKEKECIKCRKVMRSDNLKRHKKICSTSNNNHQMLESNNQQQQQPKDLRLSSFVDGIINEKPKTDEKMIQPLKSLNQDAASYSSYEERQPKNLQLSSFVNSIISADDKSKKHTSDGERMQPQEMFMPKRKMIGSSSDEESESDMLPLKKRKRSLLFKQPSRVNRSQMIGPSSNEEESVMLPPKKRKSISQAAEKLSVLSESDDNESSDASMCIDDLPPPPTSSNIRSLPTSSKIRFLPLDIGRLKDRFEQLFVDFVENEQYQHRNEIVSILDELLRRNAITHEEYTKVNDFLCVKDGVGKEEVTEDDVYSKISKTLKHIIIHDRNEIEELLTMFEEMEEEDDEEKLQTLRKLIEEWVLGELAPANQEVELEDILELLNKLKDSKPRSKLLRIEMILQDIRENRKRVQDALRHVYNVFKDNDTPEERMRVLQHLLKHKLISMEQYDNLKEKVDVLDKDMIISEIKNTKIGRGLDFLPTTILKLKHKVIKWLKEIVEKRSEHLRQKLFGALNELLQRRAISKAEYKDKVEQYII